MWFGARGASPWNSRPKSETQPQRFGDETSWKKFWETPPSVVWLIALLGRSYCSPVAPAAFTLSPCSSGAMVERFLSGAFVGQLNNQKRMAIAANHAMSEGAISWRPLKTKLIVWISITIAM